MTMFKSTREIREEKNYLAFESLKIALADCPNSAFNKDVLSFVRPFIKSGSIKKEKKFGVYTMCLNDSNYRAYIWIKNEKEKSEITISLIPNSKRNFLNTFRRKVVFERNMITLIDTTKYEDYKSLEEKTTFSIFENNCQVNELGDNILVCKIATESQVTDKGCKKKVEAVRVNENNDAIIEKWNTTTNKNEYFKASNVFATFEDVLKGRNINLKNEEKTSLDYSINFISDWLKENFEFKKRIDAEKKNATKSVNHLALF